MNLPEAEGKGRQARPAPGSQVRRQDKPSPYRERPNSGRSMLITIATQHYTMLARNILENRPEHDPACEQGNRI